MQCSAPGIRQTRAIRPTDRHRSRHRHVKLGGNFMRREIGETRPQGFRCRGSVRKRIANRGEFGGAIQPPSVNVGFQHHKPKRLR